jgi:type I restriction enzyme, S subunit
VRESVRPRAGEKYELFSVPTFESGQPEVLDGGVIRSTKRVVLPGDLLICKINPRINRVWYVPTSRHGLAQVASTEYLALRLHDKSIGPYLLWYCRSPRFRQWIEARVEGVTGSHTRVKSPVLLRHLVPLPSHDEQRRIVSSIEEKLSRLEAAVQSMEAAEGRVLALRKSVYHHLLQVNWPTVPLGTLVQASRPITYGILMPKANIPDGVPYVRVKDMKADGIDIAGLRRTSQVIADEYQRSMLRTGDVLVSIRGTYGRVAVVPDQLDGANITQDTARVAPGPNIRAAYLAAALRAPAAQAYMRRVARGVAVKGVNLGDLRVLPIRLPPMALQAQLIGAVQEQVERISGFDTVIMATLRRARLLRQSILDAAFTGRLGNGSLPADNDRVIHKGLVANPAGVSQ